MWIKRVMMCLFIFQGEAFVGMYVAYCKNKPFSNSLLIEHGGNFFSVSTFILNTCHRVGWGRITKNQRRGGCRKSKIRAAVTKKTQSQPRVQVNEVYLNIKQFTSHTKVIVILSSRILNKRIMNLFDPPTERVFVLLYAVLFSCKFISFAQHVSFSVCFVWGCVKPSCTALIYTVYFLLGLTSKLWSRTVYISIPH